MLSKIAHVIYKMKLNQSSLTLIDRFKLRIIDVFFNLFKKSNPLVKVYVGQYKLQLPFSHRLPFIIKLDPYYSTNLARIGKRVLEKYSDLKLIDIGANVGDSVALLRTESTFPILCIEGDDYFFSILEKNAVIFPNLHLAKNYVGESTAEVNAVSVESEGTAHIGQNEVGDGAIHIEKLSAILEVNPLFKGAKMLKVDTDGFDNKILRGSVDFLENAKPVIFFEYDPFFLSQQGDNGLSIFDTLFSIGYQDLLIYENNGELMLSVNLQNRMLLEDITHFYTGRKGLRYCDMCAFHKEDNDLFNTVRKGEIEFFKKSRSSNAVSF